MSSIPSSLKGAAVNKPAKLMEEHYKVATRIDLHNQTEVKLALDDFLRQVAEDLFEFKIDNTYTDIKLVLGFIACFAAGSAALYAHLNAFAETKVIVIAGVIVYATLMGLTAYITYYHESHALFAGSVKQGKTSTELEVFTELEYYGVEYEIMVKVKQPEGAKEHKVVFGANTIIDTKGNLFADEYLALLQDLFGKALNLPSSHPLLQKVVQPPSQPAIATTTTTTDSVIAAAPASPSPAAIAASPSGKKAKKSSK